MGDCGRHGIRFACPVESELLIQAARIAKFIPGDEWLLENEDEVRDFIDRGRDVLKSSTAGIGSCARFSMNFHPFDEPIWGTSRLCLRHQALPNGSVFHHVPLRVRLSPEEKEPRSHWTLSEDILPPYWAEDAEQTDI